MFKKLQSLFFTRGFYKGITFELILFVLSIGLILWAALQIPFDADAYNDQVSTAAFLMMGVVGVTSTLFIRAIFVKGYKKIGPDSKVDSRQAKIATKIAVLTLALPLLAYLILLPWILAGVFDDERMGTASSASLLFLLGVVIMPLLSILAGAFIVFPIESTIRGAVRVIRTRGKEWRQLAIGLFGLEVLALIAVGFFAIDPHSSGVAGQWQVFWALIGVPGAYAVKSEALLWVARLLFAIFLGVLLFVRYIGQMQQAADDINKA